MEFTTLDAFNEVWYDEVVKSVRKEFSTMQPIQFDEPKYSKKQITKAGRALAVVDDLQQAEEPLAILDNWRAAHAYPLSVIAGRLTEIAQDAMVVQRLKRLDSIWGKLKRFPDMDLARMQDLGGCRAIVQSIPEIYKTVESYKETETNCILKREYDYVQNPKTSGYRSYHVVYQFFDEHHPKFNNGILVEMQVRTKLQHVWATALEVMGIYTKSALKSGFGDAAILRFFVLMSSVFALKEGTPVCPDTSDDYNELAAEIAKLDKEHDIMQGLIAISIVIRHAKESECAGGTEGYHILVLDYKKRTLSTYHYSSDEIGEATETYNRIEEHNDPDVNVVLVAADSLNTIRDAYPNYFIDTSAFVQIANEVIADGKQWLD